MTAAAAGQDRSACALTIWGRLNAHNVQKVVWVSQELGLDYHRIGRGCGVVDIGGLPHVKRWHAELTRRPAMHTAMEVEWSSGG